MSSEKADRCAGCANKTTEYYEDLCMECSRFYADRYEALTELAPGGMVRVQGESMKSNALKIGGIVAIVGGSAALYLAGTGEAVVGGIVAAVFVLAGIIASVFRVEK